MFSASDLFTMLLAGACATVAVDFFGQSPSPALGSADLTPVPLANNVIQVLFRQPWRPFAIVAAAMVRWREAA